MIPKFKKVLAVTDCSEIGNRAIPFAYTVVSVDGEVQLVHLIEHGDVPGGLYAHYTRDELFLPEKRKEVAEKVEKHLEQLIPQEARDKSIRTQVACAFHGEIAAGIIEEIKNRSPDVVVIGSHGRSALTHLLMGSVTEQVLRHSTVPVLVVPQIKK